MWGRRGGTVIVVALLLAACGPGIQTMGPFKQQTHWKVAELDDGGIVVTLKPAATIGTPTT
jgi:hypothetical protein